MNTLQFLSSPVTDALGWTLLHALWQGFALVLPVAIALHVLRNQSSTLRYQISVFTLLTQLMVSVGTFIWYYEPVSNSHPVAPLSTARYAMQIRWQTVSQTLPWHQQTQRFLEDHLSQFVLVYLIGVALFGLRLAGGWVYLQHLRKTAMQPTAGWTQLTNRLRSALSIRAVIQVRESSRIVVPVVIGVLKPVLLLPVGLAANLSIREVEAVLAHELAHVKRHDYAVNLLQSVVEVLYFFHPALWWLSARVREEREHCCDDLAVAVSGGDGRILAQALARVEELRLSQFAQTPSLAMAFAANRHHLLHRVRRVLGVQTKPFVSNGSLAGLTLATILLMSVSVYAVQKQDKPKASASQPKPTRRHRIDKTSEYGIADNHKVSYIIWKGKKLSTTRVVALQRQLDQVMAGQLSLDNVPQPDRDILLTIIEKNYAFDAGMDALAEGMSHINYNNIVTSALKNVPLSPDGTVEGLAKVNYDSIIQSAMSSIPPSAQLLLDSLRKKAGINQSAALDSLRQIASRQMDSLGRLMAQRSAQVRTMQLQMEKLQFPIEEFQRSADELNWRKEKLTDQRNTLIEKHQRLLQNTGKQKLSTAEVEKQLQALQPEIKKLEGSMEAMNQQMEALNAKQEAAKVPLEQLEQQSEQLDKQMELLEEQMEKNGEIMEHMLPEIPDVNVNTRVNGFARPLLPLRPTRALPPVPAVAPTPAAPLRGHIVPAKPATPIKANVNVRVKPASAPVPSMKTAPTPPTPKPAVAPKLE